MKASIMTFSQTGNTLRVGHSIANGLQGSGVDVDHVRFSHRDKWSPDDADLIGIGCPVFENRPAEVVPAFLKDSGLNLIGKKAFVFITSGGSPAKSLWHLAQFVTKAGATIIGGVQIRGVGTFPTLFGLFPDRPNEEDFKYAEGFGTALAANLMNGKALPAHYKIDPNIGGKFYDVIGPFFNHLKKKATPLPESDPDKCDFCGTCVNECPTGSISIMDKAVKFKSTCVVCYRCWHICPRDAISIQFSPGNGFLERLFYSEKMERLFGNIKPDEYVGTNLYKDVLARKIKLKYDRNNPTAEYEHIK